MILNYKTLSNKILQTFNPLNEGYKAYVVWSPVSILYRSTGTWTGKGGVTLNSLSRTQVSSTAQSTEPSKKRRSLSPSNLPKAGQVGETPELSTNKITLSEYLSKIVTVSKKIEHRTGFAQVLDRKINNLKTSPDLNSFLGYNNLINLVKNTSGTGDAKSSNTLAPYSINEAKYSNLVLSQLSELSQIAQNLGVSSIFNYDEKNLVSQDGIRKAESNIRHYLNLLTKFEYKLSNSYYDYFHFNKSNNNKYLFAMEKATNLLKIAFLSKGCLISKPIFNIVYTPTRIEEEILNSFDKTSSAPGPVTGHEGNPKIIINLFYFVNSAFTANSADTNLTSIGLQNAKRTKQIKLYENKLNGILQSFVNADITNNSNRNITNIFSDKFLYLSEYLNKLFDCDVELNLVRLYLPYQDSNILAQFLNIGSFKKRFVYLASRLFRTVKIFNNTKIASRRIKTTLPNGRTLPACILNGPFGPLSGEDATLTARPFRVEYPSGVSGINIKLAGRTPTQKLIPRVAVRRAQRGNFSRLNSKMIEKSMCIDTSKKGAFNFTVKLSHIFR